MKIAFDLDGVLVPDYDISHDGLENVRQWVEMRCQLVKPMFYMPECVNKPVFITGRPSEDIGFTLPWIRRHFSDFELWHANRDLSKGAEYKAEVLNTKPEIKMFVESCEKQVAYLKRHVTTECKIIHFESAVRKALIREYYDV